MKTLNDKTKVTLSVGQLQGLVKESRKHGRTRTTESNDGQADTLSRNKCPDIDPDTYPKLAPTADHYIVLSNHSGQNGCVWGPFGTYDEAHDILFAMATAFEEEGLGRLRKFEKSSLIFSDGIGDEETTISIVPGCGWNSDFPV